MLSVTVVSVKPEMVTEFENFMKTTTNPALSKGGLAWRDVWRTTGVTGDPWEYILVAPINNIAELDGPGALEKGLGREGLAAWQAKAGSYVNSVRRYVIRTRPELSHLTNMAGPPKLAVVNTVRVAPGRSADYESYIRNDLLPVIKRSDAPGWWLNQTVFGGDPNEYITLTLHENFAELEKGPPARRVLGPEGAMQLSRKLAPGVVESVDRTLVRYVPELAFGRAQPPSR